MKLNQDCTRDLMLYLEENLKLNDYLSVSSISLKNYSPEELIYTADKLYEARYLNCSRTVYDNIDLMIFVSSITYTGHQFLDNIRDEKVFTKTKSILSTFKSVSVEIISETASKVITNMINQQLNS